MARFQAFADAQEVVVRDVGGNVVDRFSRIGMESMHNMDKELVRLGYALEPGGWTTERVGDGMRSYRRMSK